MQDVDLGVLFDGEHESLLLRDVERPVSVNSQFWHLTTLTDQVFAAHNMAAAWR